MEFAALSAGVCTDFSFATTCTSRSKRRLCQFALVDRFHLRGVKGSTVCAVCRRLQETLASIKLHSCRLHVRKWSHYRDSGHRRTLQTRRRIVLAATLARSNCHNFSKILNAKVVLRLRYSVPRILNPGFSTAEFKHNKKNRFRARASVCREN
ncbi:hypothetical protein PUN28_003481 [Cardiocondyla obscurior]|uniref:Uncharacterized protein n=1 Tax=Cardiocondyla obscurior TaxID=286306 RepID=A0AAW2GNJ7_9HYME